MIEEVGEIFVDILPLAVDEKHHQMTVLQLSSLALVFQLYNKNQLLCTITNLPGGGGIPA